jgi:hypothetical protein
MVIVLFLFEKWLVSCFRAGSIAVNACLIVLRRTRFPGRAWLLGFPVSRVAQYDHLSTCYRRQPKSPKSAPLISADFAPFSGAPRRSLCGFRISGPPGVRFPHREYVL